MAVSIKTALLGELDAIAKARQIQAAAIAALVDAWTRSNATDGNGVGEDFETFQNRMCVQAVTDMDAVVGAGQSGIVWKPWFDRLASYARLDLGLTGPDYRKAYLASIGARCPWEANEAIIDAYGTARALDPAYVFGKGTLVASEADPDPATSGLYKFGRWVSSGATAGAWAETDGALDITKISGAPILAVNNSATQTANLTVTCYRADGIATKDVVVAFAGANKWLQKVVGEAAVLSALTVGDDHIHCTGVAAAGVIIAGERVLLWESDTKQEVVTVGVVSADSFLITDVGGLKTTGFTYGNVKMWPLFSNGVGKSVTSGTNLEQIDLLARPDRIIAIT